MTVLRQEDGFTLVELLVSLVLLSLMAVYALSAFSTLKDFNRVEAEIGSQLEVEAVAKHFRDAISDIRPVFQMDQNNKRHLQFKGSPDSIEFVAASGGDRETGGLYRVRYRLTEERALVVEREMLRDNADTQNSLILLRAVKGLEFTYTGNKSGTEDASTSDRWVDGEHLPRSIGINVVFDSSDKRRWRLRVWAVHTGQ